MAAREGAPSSRDGAIPSEPSVAAASAVAQDEQLVRRRGDSRDSYGRLDDTCVPARAGIRPDGAVAAFVPEARVGRPVTAGASWLLRLGGYSIVTADDLETAVWMATSCPTLERGGGVEVGVLAALPQEHPAEQMRRRLAGV